MQDAVRAQRLGPEAWLSNWPETTFDRVPPLSFAHELAARVRDATVGMAWRHSPLSDLSAIYSHGPFAVEQTTLRGAARGLQGLLIPEPDGLFRVLVDPEPPGGWEEVEPWIRSDLERHRARFLVAHEIAHSFFYERHAEGIRRRAAASVEQEEFCDEFARALLLPPAAAAAAELTASEIVRLHREYDVSVELAARALAAAHGRRVACWVMVIPHQGPPLAQWQCGTTQDVDRRTGWLRRLVELARTGGTARGSVQWRKRGQGYVEAVHLARRRQVVAVAQPPA